MYGYLVFLKAKWQIFSFSILSIVNKYVLYIAEPFVFSQVHNRSEYLQHLISSLRSARDIEQTLLIFSHDVYSSELNNIVASIDFCPVSL